MLGAFGEDALEAHGRDLRGEVIEVNQLGVVEHFGLDAEERVQLVALDFDLFGKFDGVVERCERVGVRFGDKFDAACVGQTLEQVDEFGHILLYLLDGGTGNRD